MVYTYPIGEVMRININYALIESRFKALFKTIYEMNLSKTKYDKACKQTKS